jgi:hypothetical protein
LLTARQGNWTPDFILMHKINAFYGNDTINGTIENYIALQKRIFPQRCICVEQMHSHYICDNTNILVIVV